MASSGGANSIRDKMRARRERLRRQGLRPIQIWVPDIRSRASAAEAHRQSLAVAKSRFAKVDQAFIDALSTHGRRMRRYPDRMKVGEHVTA
jgi:hypothetical protein